MTIRIDLMPLAPVLVPAAALVLLLVLDAVAPRLGRWHWLLAAAALFGGAVLAFPGVLPGSRGMRRSLCDTAGQCAYAVDHIGTGLQILTLASAGVVALLAWPARAPRGRAAVQASLVLATAAGSADCSVRSASSPTG